MGKFRLLSKREIDTAKAKDRQREIEEGMKIAKRVDVLRQTSASEEAGLDEFRRKQLAHIQSQIDPKILELQAIESEIRQRKQEREVLLRPLSEKWNEVKQKEIEIDKKAEETAQKEAQLKLSISANIQRERDNEIEGGRIADERARTTEILVQTDKLHSAAKEELAYAQKKGDVMNAALALREKEVSIREGNVAKKGIENKEYFDKLVKYEQKLFLDDLQIKERWKVLLNTEKEYADPKRGSKKG